MEASLLATSSAEPVVDTGHLEARWLGQVPYDEAYDLQKRLVAARQAGEVRDQLLLLEHPPILTLGRHSDPRHILASPAELASRGIDIRTVERGGEVTYHGPGQLVGYPIVAIAERGLLLRPFVRCLEAALVETCAAFGVTAASRAGHPGCWCDPDDADPRKIGALGLRLERGISYHGVALNVDPDLSAFKLIDPCGMPGLRSTSIAAESGAHPVPVDAAARAFASAFASGIGASLAWVGA